MILEQLTDWDGKPDLPSLDLHPFRDPDVLQEAQVLGVSIDSLRKRVGVLFDLRLALQIDQGNVGVLVVRNVGLVNWASEGWPTDRVAWSVQTSRPLERGGLVGIDIQLWPLANLNVAGESVSFFVGSVLRLSDVPPNYTSCDEGELRGGVANWQDAVVDLHVAL